MRSMIHFGGLQNKERSMEIGPYYDANQLYSEKNDILLILKSIDVFLL